MFEAAELGACGLAARATPFLFEMNMEALELLQCLVLADYESCYDKPRHMKPGEAFEGLPQETKEILRSLKSGDMQYLRKDLTKEAVEIGLGNLEARKRYIERQERRARENKHV